MKNNINFIAISVVVLLATSCATPRAASQTSVGISVRVGPPALPFYAQPVCPSDGYLWTPGYWAYGNEDYFWVSGVWVSPPQLGFLWTPGYWGYNDGGYGFHGGYWGRHIGFYGGINYGYGYGGSGYDGGQWRGNSFSYNTAVTNVNTTVVNNTYVNKTVINNTTINNRTSFNGQGGVQAQPRQEERIAMNEKHVLPTNEQVLHQGVASQDRNQFASVNHGRPTISGMNRVNGNKISSEDYKAAPSAINIGNNSTRLNNTPLNAQRINQLNNPSQSYTKPNQLPLSNTARVHSKQPQQPASQQFAPQRHIPQYNNKPPQQHVSQYNNKPPQQHASQYNNKPSPPHFQAQQQRSGSSRQGNENRDQHHK